MKTDLETRMKQAPHVTKEDIKACLNDLGLSRTDRIMVHSSLSAFGYVEPREKPQDEAIVEAILKDPGHKGTKEATLSKVRAANTVIDALWEYVGDDGVLMLPSFNHGSAEIYDPLTTRCTNGIIPDVFWRTPGVKRSLHPTHPYAAVGKNVDELLAGNEEVSTFSKDCPLGRLVYQKGYILLLGVGLTACTAKHIGETVSQAPCLGYRETVGKIVRDGKVFYVRSDVWRDSQCSIGQDLEKTMRKANMIKDTTIGNAAIHLLRGLGLVDTTIALARKHCPECTAKPNYKKAADMAAEEILTLQEQDRIRD